MTLADSSTTLEMSCVFFTALSTAILPMYADSLAFPAALEAAWDFSTTSTTEDDISVIARAFSSAFADWFCAPLAIC